MPVDADGTHVLTYTAADAAANTSAEQRLTVKVDATKPVPAFGPWPTGVIRQGEVPAEPACLGTDATSGVASCVQTGYSVALGRHTITQTVLDRAGNRASTTLSYVVTVAVPPATPVVSRVKLNQAQLRLARGTSLRLEEGVYLSDGSASYAGTAVWTSSNRKVATVSPTGVVRAKKAGKVRITVTTRRPGASGTRLSTGITVKVVASRSRAKVTRVAASVPTSMRIGQSAYVTGRYFPARATGVKVTYRSSSTGVARVDVAGRILARAAGVATITVTAGGRSKTYRVAVS